MTFVLYILVLILFLLYVKSRERKLNKKIKEGKDRYEIARIQCDELRKTINFMQRGTYNDPY